MDIRPLSDTYSVSPQIEPEDIAAIKAAGYTTVICNRPDAEIPPELQADAMRALVEGAGMGFVLNPVIGGALTQENVDAQRNAIDEASGPVLAYCASGNRSSIVWALANAGRKPTDDLIAAGAQYGYQLAQFRELIDRLAKG
ncbi:TIGR01244 family phosphatase [Rhodobacter sp. NTK016B]|uniref:TIGR01244 family sulfur transferase n=1 Tax=Rhodobacter sp. NTK016B TaxID=2759676 RepID=UPI001A8F46E9|nr:TIGR01244 family sulfur transferase [Rhodobacter sp. NTK016B]MBN8291368.1 TIGR01244 family phosphatase [Rhodobacter sp. NTK016B]